MAESTVTIKIDIDARTGGIDAVRTRLIQLAAEAEAVDQHFSNLSDRANLLHSSFVDLDKEVKKKQEDFDNMSKSVHNNNKAMDNNGKAARRNGRALDDLGRRMKDKKDKGDKFAKMLQGMVKFGFKAFLINLAASIVALVGISAAFKAGAALAKAWQATVSAAFQVATAGAAAAVTGLSLFLAGQKQYLAATQASRYKSQGDGLTMASSALRSLTANTELAVFGTEALQGAFQQLSTYTPMTGKLSKAMEAMGDFAATTADPKKTFAAAGAFIGQLQKEGKLTDSLVKSASNIGPEFARAAEEAKKAGKTTADEFINALIAGELSKEVAGQLDTVNMTLFGTAKRNFTQIKELFSDFGQPLLKPATEAMQRVADIFKKTFWGVSGAIRAFANEELFNGVTGGLNKFSVWVVKTFNEYLPKVDGMIGRLKDFFNLFGDGWKRFKEAIRPLQEGGQILIDTFGPLVKGFFQGFGGGLYDFNRMIIENKDQLLEFGQALLTTFQQIGKLFGVLKQALLDSTPALTTIVSVIGDMVTTFTELLGIARKIGEWIMKIGSAVGLVNDEERGKQTGGGVATLAAAGLAYYGLNKLAKGPDGKAPKGFKAKLGAAGRNTATGNVGGGGQPPIGSPPPLGAPRQQNLPSASMVITNATITASVVNLYTTAVGPVTAGGRAPLPPGSPLPPPPPGAMPTPGMPTPGMPTPGAQGGAAGGGGRFRGAMGRVGGAMRSAGRGIGNFAAGLAPMAAMTMIPTALQSETLGGGAVSGALGGAGLGFMVGGPIGAVVGTIGGAIVGGIVGSFNAGRKEIADIKAAAANFAGAISDAAMGALKASDMSSYQVELNKLKSPVRAFDSVFNNMKTDIIAAEKEAMALANEGTPGTYTQEYIDNWAKQFNTLSGKALIDMQEGVGGDLGLKPGVWAEQAADFEDRLKKALDNLYASGDISEDDYKKAKKNVKVYYKSLVNEQNAVERKLQPLERNRKENLEKLSKLTGKTTQELGDLANKMGYDLTNSMEDFKDAIEDLTDINIYDSVGEMKAALSDTISQAVIDVFQKPIDVKRAGETVKESGRAIMQMLQEGITPDAAQIGEFVQAGFAYEQALGKSPQEALLRIFEEVGAGGQMFQEGRQFAGFEQQLRPVLDPMLRDLIKNVMGGTAIEDASASLVRAMETMGIKGGDAAIVAQSTRGQMEKALAEGDVQGAVDTFKALMDQTQLILKGQTKPVSRGVDTLAPTSSASQTKALGGQAVDLIKGLEPYGIKVFKSTLDGIKSNISPEVIIAGRNIRTSGAALDAEIDRIARELAKVKIQSPQVGRGIDGDTATPRSRLLVGRFAKPARIGDRATPQQEQHLSRKHIARPRRGSVSGGIVYNPSEDISLGGRRSSKAFQSHVMEMRRKGLKPDGTKMTLWEMAHRDVYGDSSSPVQLKDSQSISTTPIDRKHIARPRRGSVSGGIVYNPSEDISLGGRRFSKAFQSHVMEMRAKGLKPDGTKMTLKEMSHKTVYGDRSAPVKTLATTMNRHAVIDATVPGKRTVTSSYRTYGLGSMNSDHVTGRAYDLIGQNLGAYAQQIRNYGGFAEFHGQAGNRHLHVVPGSGIGDTASSVAPVLASSSVSVLDRVNSFSESNSSTSVVAGPSLSVQTTPSSTVNNSYSFTINATESQTPDQIADAVMRRIHREQRSARERQ